ncbi:MAG: hypothetical protein K8U03_06100 [Planctomycetia bacterium]|nr:hypothetical protein [Planctomycetia bacterium]
MRSPFPVGKWTVGKKVVTTMQFEWTVFFGDAGDAEARVYVLAAPIVAGDPSTVDQAELLAGLKITGRVEGPKCRYSHTLPARIPVQFRGMKTTDGKSLLVGEAIVPDPNMWTPELPFLYRATVEVRRGAEVIASYEQDFGIRPLGVIGRRLVYCGKTWVPRVVNRDIVKPVVPLEEWRDAATAMSVVEPDDALCREASEIGVVLIAGVRQGPGRDALATVRRLSRYPAVVIALIESVLPLPPEFRLAARNTLLASWQPSPPPAEEADATDVFLATKYSFVRIGDLDTVWDSLRPVFAFSPLQNAHSLEEARARCDELQADLAGKCHPAGYLV